MARRYFTLEEANRKIPEVAARMQCALQLHVVLRQSIDKLNARGASMTQKELEGAAVTGAPEDTAEGIETARALYRAVLDEIRAIEAAGAEVKGIPAGLVDFWSYLDGEREVLLCWKLGEKRIEHYHSAEDGFAGRKPTAGHLFLREPSVALEDSTDVDTSIEVGSPSDVGPKSVPLGPPPVPKRG
jgi:hypothetical protein